jgi:hypothetical protein
MSTALRPAKPKKPAKKRLAPKRKPGVTAKVRPDPKFLRRLAELGISPITTDEVALEMFLELQRKHSLGELAYLWDAALTAMKAAAYKSDNLDDWLDAGRKAAGLDPRPKK